MADAIPLLKEIESCWRLLAATAAQADPRCPVEEAARAARQSIQNLLFLGAAETAGILPQGELDAAAARFTRTGEVRELSAAGSDQLGAGLFFAAEVHPGRPAHSRPIVPAAAAMPACK